MHTAQWPRFARGDGTHLESTIFERSNRSAGGDADSDDEPNTPSYQLAVCSLSLSTGKRDFTCSPACQGLQASEREQPKRVRLIVCNVTAPHLLWCDPTDIARATYDGPT